MSRQFISKRPGTGVFGRRTKEKMSAALHTRMVTRPTNVLQPRFHCTHSRRTNGCRQVNKFELVQPAEDVGRDTLSRYDMQFQAAAYAALEILEGKSVTFVYCDYHDDFVVRHEVNGETFYHFFQVKTKEKLNHQWSLNEIFAIKLRGQKIDAESLAKIKSSFAGKLYAHCIAFDNECIEVTLLSNVHFTDDVVDAIDQLSGKAGKNKAATLLQDNFSSIFEQTPAVSAERAAETLVKLSLRPGVNYIDKEGERFAAETRSAIYKYSEIDLTFFETKELANGLVNLVFKKSKTPLAGIAPQDIAGRVGVGLEDLLDVLSISRAAYDALAKGEDPKVLKQASAIQRWLKGAGAGEAMIEFASQQKVTWDLWLRTARHNYSPLDLNQLLDGIDKLYHRWVASGAGFDFLNELLEDFHKSSFLIRFNGLSRELLFGAVSSVVVKVYSK